MIKSVKQYEYEWVNRYRTKRMGKKKINVVSQGEYYLSASFSVCFPSKNYIHTHTHTHIIINSGAN